jgi:PAS domain S-box-containing protein
MTPSDPAQRLEKDLECPATAVVTTSLDGTILAWNAGAEKVWGYTAKEVLGKHISILEHPRSGAVVPAIGEIARNGKSVRPKRALGRGKDGRTRIVALSAVPVVDRNGDVSAVSATVHDLTQERRKEAIGHRLVDIFTHTQIGVCIASPVSNTFEMVNPAFAQMHGYEAEELTGRPVADIFPPDRRGEAEGCLRAAQEHGRHSLETEHVRRDGTRFPVLIDVTCVRGPDGAVRHFVADVHDISRAVWAEQRARQADELRRRGEELREVIRQMQAGVMIAEAGTETIRQSNDEAERILGLAVRSGSTLDAVRRGVRAARPDGTPLRAGEWPLDRSLRGEVVGPEEIHLVGEARRVLLASSAPVRDARGHVELAVATFHDITDRKLREDETARLNATLERRVAERTAELSRTVRELEAFAYTVAHDLRAPLRAMYGFADLLVRESEPTPVASEHARRIREAAGHMDRLITDLLAYARHAHSEVRPKPVFLGPALDRALERWRDRISQGEIEVAVPPLLPVVLGDEGILVESIAQLVDNALKFVRPGERPRVRISCERRGGGVRLAVEDRGIGIAPEHHGRIFGVFERLNRVEEYPGTGIGLAIVRKGVEKLGGRLGLESEPGKGSRFWIELPEASSAAP